MILSIENFTNWSWSSVLTDMIPLLSYPVRRFVRDCRDLDFKYEGPIPDAYLLQNADCFSVFSTANPLVNGVCRLGGFSMKSTEDIIDHSVYDERLKHVGAIIATNHMLYRYARSLNRNSVLLPNGIDLQVFVPRMIPLETEKFQVGFAGNINSSFYLCYKGYQFIAGACNELFDTVSLVTALYRVSQKPHDVMVSDFYRKIHCVVNMSQGEGCSNTIMEALACGVPVICTKVGFHGEMLEHEKNVLFVPRNSVALRDAISRLRQDKDLLHRLSYEGRKFAEQHHDICVIANGYNGIFEQILKGC